MRIKLRVKYIYQLQDWPQFHWDQDIISPILSEARYKQGRLLGFMDGLGFDQKNETNLRTLTDEVVKSAEIEGEILNSDQVRSSIARKLNLEVGGLIPVDKNVEGMVKVIIDATHNFDTPLYKERLLDWHSTLFPTGKSGNYYVEVGKWRSDEKGPMQVISGPLGKEKTHFEAPEAAVLEKEMNRFLEWFNTDSTDSVLKSGIAHLWFVTIHPFDDGNGRIARAIADMQLAKSDGVHQRFYSMSAQIRNERSDYYNILEKTQKGSLDITDWLTWFLNCLIHALNVADDIRLRILNKTKFWDKHSKTEINERQRLIINKLFDGFEGNLTTKKWAKITKCSHDTALRDITDLIEKNILERGPAGGRSTNYILKN